MQSPLWQEPLFQRLRGRPYPLLSFANAVVPAASVWSGGRLWTRAFREAGLCPGDRLVLALAPSPAFVQVLVAALWEGLTIAFVPPLPADAPAADIAVSMDAVDARAAVAETNGDTVGVFRPDGCEGPLHVPAVRAAHFGPTPDVRFLLKTSGTTAAAGGAGRWIALRDDNLWAVLDSHLPLLNLPEGGRVLSVLPWHHAFGLVLDLLPALLSGCEIICDPHSGKNAPALLARGQAEQAHYLCAVPLVLERLRNLPGGDSFLQSLHGGIVGGAPVNASLAGFLATTRLRVGYGQTEASPGIALGNAGQWPHANFLGSPVGCEVRIDKQNQLLFKGKNAHAGTWTPGTGFVPNPDQAGWNPSGDLAGFDSDKNQLVWKGRADDVFKMASGRFVEAGRWEQAIQAACPRILDALLCSPDGHTLVWYLHVAPESGNKNDRIEPALLRRTLGSSAGGGLSRLATKAFLVPESGWVRTPKGTINRRETLACMNHASYTALPPF